MPFAITIPRLGWSMEEGTFVRWLKNDGDVVQAGDAVFELEGEKAAQDIEAVDAGILRIPADAPRPGTVVPVGATIGFLVSVGEVVPQSVGAGSASPPAVQQPKEAIESAAVLPQTSHAPAETAAAPSVRRLAREQGVSLAALAGTGPAGRIMAEDVLAKRLIPDSAAATAGSRDNPRDKNAGTVPRPLAPSRTEAGAIVSKFASPRARRVAKSLGIDWRRLKGTGRDGRVREIDVRKSEVPVNLNSISVAIPVSSRRRTIANRMLASREQTASVTLTTRLDATNLVGLRQQFKQSANDSLIPSYSDIIIKLVSLALQQHPLLAARSDAEGWVIPVTSDGLHIGMAVDTEEGLVVPVIQSVGTLGLFELAKRTQVLIDKSRKGTLSVSEMQGGVFTITNLGSFGIDSFTPIINLPETAVLGLGRIRREPVVVEDQIVARDQMTLSLTFDHRIIDGAPAARFLQTVSQAIENPSAWLLRGAS